MLIWTVTSEMGLIGMFFIGVGVTGTGGEREMLCRLKNTYKFWMEWAANYITGYYAE